MASAFPETASRLIAAPTSTRLGAGERAVTLSHPLLVPHVTAVSDSGRRLDIDCATDDPPPGNETKGTPSTLATPEARLRGYLGAAGPVAERMRGPLIADSLAVVTERAGEVMSATGVATHLQRPVKFWAALELLLLGVPPAVVVAACFEERPGRSPERRIVQYHQILESPVVRDALTLVRRVGLVSFLRECMTDGDRVAGEIDRAERLVKAAELAAQTRPLPSAGPSGAEGPDISVGCEFLAASRPYLGGAQTVAARDKVYNWIRRYAQRHDSSYTLECCEVYPSIEFAHNFPITTVIQEVFHYRGATVIARRWGSRGVTLYSAHLLGNEESMVVERAGDAKTVFDAEAPMHETVVKLLHLRSVEDLRQLMAENENYRKSYRLMLHGKRGEVATCNVQWDKEQRAVVECLNARFRHLPETKIFRKRVIKARTYETLIMHLHATLGGAKPGWKLVQDGRTTGIRLEDGEASVHLRLVDDPFYAVESSRLRRAQLPMLGRVFDALADKGFVGTTSAMPIGMQARATLPIAIDGVPTIEPLLRLVRAYLQDAELIEALLSPRPVRRAFLGRIPPGLEKLLMTPTYAPRPGNLTDLLCVLTDFHRHISASEYCEMNMLPYLEALTRLVQQELYKVHPRGCTIGVDNWHEENYYFHLYPPGIGELYVIHSLPTGTKSYVLVPEIDQRTEVKIDAPYVELRLGNTPHILGANGTYRIASDAIVWLAEFWANYCWSRGSA